MHCISRLITIDAGRHACDFWQTHKLLILCICNKLLHKISDRFALPDVERTAQQQYLSAEGAEVFGVLADFNFLDLLPQTRTISGSVLSDNSDFLCTLGLQHSSCSAKPSCCNGWADPGPGDYAGVYRMQRTCSYHGECLERLLPGNSGGRLLTSKPVVRDSPPLCLEQYFTDCISHGD